VLEGRYLTLLVEMAAIQERSGQPCAAIEGLSRVVAPLSIQLYRAIVTGQVTTPA
jgi:hypothetical protein